MKKTILLFASFVLLIITINAQTTVPALITTNQTWTASGNPYILNQNSYIDTGVIVKVMPGVIIKSNAKKIVVQGSFQCLGNLDSLIQIDTTTIEFGNQSKDYNVTTGDGAYFNYTQFNYVSTSSIPYCIITNSTSLRVENSIFKLGYYGIYVNSTMDSVRTEVFNSKFIGAGLYNSGYPIYGSTLKGYFKVIDNEFSKLYSIFMSGNIIFNGNHCDDLSHIGITQTFGDLQMNCNKFLNMGRNIEISISNSTSLSNMFFKSNLLDNLCKDAGFSNYYMLNVNRVFPVNSALFLNDNNFLNHGGSSNNKLRIIGKNGGPTVIDSINVKDNYWNTIDSLDIESFCHDFNDDFNYPRLIFSKFSKTLVASCSKPSECALPDFNFTIDEDVVTFTDNSKSSKYYKVIWHFGDGTIDATNSKTVKHTYLENGNQLVCLYVTDSFDNVCDSICKVVNIDFSTCKASIYYGVDTSNIKKLYIINNSFGLTDQTDYAWIYGLTSGTYTYKYVKNPGVTYANQGLFRVCLAISDDEENCNSSICDTIQITSNGTEVRFIENLVSTKDIKKINENAVNVYPNPNNGTINVAFETPLNQVVQFEVFNIFGQNVFAFSQPIEEGQTMLPLDLTHLKSGIYWLKIYNNEFNKVVKIEIAK